MTETITTEPAGKRGRNGSVILTGLVTIPRANEAPETTPGYSWPMRR